MRKQICLHLAILSLLVCAVPALAQDKDPDPAEAAKAVKEAEAAYRDKFLLAERRARQTRDAVDDLAFIKRLITEADSGRHSEALAVLLYEKAYTIGLRDVSMYPTASLALDKLLEKDASRKFDIGEMRLVLWEKWHLAQPDQNPLDPEDFIDLCLSLSQEAMESGDFKRAMSVLNRGSRFASRTKSPRITDVRDSIAEVTRMRRASEEIAELEKLLGTDPTVPDQLAMVYLAHLDDPAKAATYTDLMTDKELAAKVTLAATEFELATPNGAREAGVFYVGLVDDAKTRQPIAMLIRARVWLTEFLSREEVIAAVKAGAEADAEAKELAQAAKETRKSLGEIDEALLKRGIGKKLRRKMSSLVRGEGQFDRPADVQAAIDKGVAWLYTQRKDKTFWEQHNESHHHWGGYTALVVYALLMADEEPRLNGDLSRSVHFLMNAKMKGVYALCFRIHAWEVLPRRERYRQQLLQDVIKLRNAGTRHGFWGYGLTGKGVVPGKRLDLSTTLAGGLGLWIGEEVGRIAPKKVHWERVARALIEHQREDHGWCYNPATGQVSQGAMTAGAIALLHASYPHLSAVTQKKADEAIAGGIEWMDKNFSPTKHVNRGVHKNYYFAAVQHAGLFCGRKEFKEMDWYDSIAEHLVKTQAANGAWGTVNETAFAIAFLCRGGIEHEPYASENADPESEDASGSTEGDAAPQDANAPAEQPAE